MSLQIVAATATTAVDTWRVTISGPSGPQVKTGAPGTSVSFTNLQPGGYSVLLEGLEAGVVILRGQGSANVVAGGTASVSVSPAPVPPTVQLEPTDLAAAEVGSNQGLVIVRRIGSTATALPVNLSVGGTAAAGQDYTVTSTSVTIQAGQQTASVIVTPLLDAVVEGNETVIITLLSGGYEIGSTSSATITIADAPVITVVATDPDATEVGAGTGTFTISRSGPVSAALPVNVSMGGSAVSGVDYQAQTIPVAIPAGQASATVTVTPLQDTAVEGPETVVMTVGSGEYAVGTPASATITIIDAAPPLPVVTIVATDPSAAEDGPDNGTFTISREGSTTAPLAVVFSVGGTAQDGVDYRTPSSAVTQLASPITIPAGQQSVALVITPLIDAVAEGDETVVVTIAASSAYSVGAAGSATITIADRVAAPVSVSLSTSAISAMVVAGGSAHRPPQIDVTSSTGQQLTGLQTGAPIYPSGGPLWVQSATLSTNVTPAKLQLVLIPVQLQPGQYSAQVPVTATGATTATLNVTLNVLAAPSGTLVFERVAVNGLSTSVELWRSAANGSPGSFLQLTANGSFDGRPAISPDGSRVAFRSDRTGNAEIWTMTINGTNPVQETNTAEIDSYPAWIGPNFLAFSAGDPLDPTIQRLRVIPAANTFCPPCPIDHPAPALGFTQAWPSAPATAPLVAFGTNHNLGGGNIFEIWTWNWQTNVYQNLTQSSTHNDNLPAFSPDGTRIAFVARRGNTNLQIFVMNANGSSVTQLTSGALNTQPAWSPDGSKIVFVTNRDGNDEIYIMNANGSNQVNISNTPNHQEGRPSWR